MKDGFEDGGIICDVGRDLVKTAVRGGEVVCGAWFEARVRGGEVVCDAWLVVRVCCIVEVVSGKVTVMSLGVGSVVGGFEDSIRELDREGRSLSRCVRSAVGESCSSVTVKTAAV